MKTIKKLIPIFFMSIVIVSSCKKDQATPKASTCNMHGRGTVEQCPTDSNLWFINMYSMLNKYSNKPGMIKTIIPKNLPMNLMIDLLSIDFDFSYLNDSVEFQCGATEPFHYAQKINLCRAEKDTINQITVKKPVIYLYPEHTSSIHVELKFAGQLTVTYPDYDSNINGWDVIAQTDGTLKNKADGMEYQNLFWEGSPSIPYHFNMKEGFCVKGTETKSFLQTILPQLGLIPKEYNDMISFWLPMMVNNKYNIIHFAGTDYTNSAKLKISPNPDNMLRVFMAYQASNEYVATTKQEFSKFNRKGFAVVEWGGMELQRTNATYAIGN